MFPGRVQLSKRAEISALPSRVNEGGAPVTIANSRGKAVVLAGEDERVVIEETLCLNSIPGMAESILAGRTEPHLECVGEDALEW